MDPFKIVVILAIVVIGIVITNKILRKKREKEFALLQASALRDLEFKKWDDLPYFDESVTVKSRQALEKYDDIKFFKDNKEALIKAENSIHRKNENAQKLNWFLENNEYKAHAQYDRLEKVIEKVQKNAGAYRIQVNYITKAGNNLGSKQISVTQFDIDRFKNDPSLLMGKAEYNKYIKEQQKEELSQKQHEYYERVNNIIDFANDNRDSLVLKGSRNQLDDLIGQLFDRTVNSIKKIKSLDSEEWTLIEDVSARLKEPISAGLKPPI